MKFSVTSLFLIATAIAAPVQEVDRRAIARTGQHESLAVRGLLALFPRAVVPLKPVPHDTTPVVNPNEPDAPAPLNPKPDPVANPNEPEQPAALRPDTEAPAPKPKPADACLLKRGCTKNPGGDATLDIDTKYQRDMTATQGPEGDYLKDAGFVGGSNKWVQLTTKNNDEVAEKLEQTWVDDLVKNQGYNEREAKNLVEDQIDDLLYGPHADFVVTSHNMKKGDGLMVAESSYNGQYDLHRPFPGTTDKGKAWKRPAIDPDQEVKWAQHAMDNLRVAAKAQGVSVKELRHIGRHNIETEDVQNILRDLMGGVPGKKTFTVAGNPAEVAKIEPTLHAKTTNALLRDNAAELGNLKITQYTVTFDGSRFDMMIDVAP